MNPVIPSSEARVAQSTDSEVNEVIASVTRKNICVFRSASPHQLTLRIRELEREWDVERLLELNAGVLTALASWLVLRSNSKWAGLSLAVGGFLALHAIQGWCPPLPVLRRMGLRTPGEIHEEILALRIMRGDFSTTADPVEALSQARAATHI